jgi:hypothetical protein
VVGLNVVGFRVEGLLVEGFRVEGFLVEGLRVVGLVGFELVGAELGAGVGLLAEAKGSMIRENLAGITSNALPGYSQAMAKLSLPPPSFMRA